MVHPNKSAPNELQRLMFSKVFAQHKKNRSENPGPVLTAVFKLPELICASLCWTGFM